MLFIKEDYCVCVCVCGTAYVKQNSRGRQRTAVFVWEGMNSSVWMMVCVCVCGQHGNVCRAEGVCARKKTHVWMWNTILLCERESGLLCMREKERVPSRLYYFVMLNGWQQLRKKTALLFLIMSSEIMSYLFNHPPPPERGSDYKLINQLSSETKKVVSSHYL